MKMCAFVASADVEPQECACRGLDPDSNTEIFTEICKIELSAVGIGFPGIVIKSEFMAVDFIEAGVKNPDDPSFMRISRCVLVIKINDGCQANEIGLAVKPGSRDVVEKVVCWKIAIVRSRGHLRLEEAGASGNCDETVEFITADQG